MPKSTQRVDDLVHQCGADQLCSARAPWERDYMQQRGYAWTPLGLHTLRGCRTRLQYLWAPHGWAWASHAPGSKYHDPAAVVGAWEGVLPYTGARCAISVSAALWRFFVGEGDDPRCFRASAEPGGDLHQLVREGLIVPHEFRRRGRPVGPPTGRSSPRSGWFHVRLRDADWSALQRLGPEWLADRVRAAPDTLALLREPTRARAVRVPPELRDKLLRLGRAWLERETRQETHYRAYQTRVEEFL